METWWWDGRKDVDLIQQACFVERVIQYPKMLAQPLGVDDEHEQVWEQQVWLAEEAIQ
jgi:hypothetical protein